MTDRSPRLAPRSAVAAVAVENVALLRVARMDLGAPETGPTGGFLGRLRALQAPARGRSRRWGRRR